MQISLIKKLIKKTYEKRIIKDDDVLDFDVESYVDSSLEYGENLTLFIERGLIDEKYSKEEEYEEIRILENQRMEKYIESMSTRCYVCQLCDDFVTPVKDFMIEHLQEEHGLEECDIPPTNPNDFTYIILDELMRLSQTKEFKHKEYIVVSNEFLWTQLLMRLGVKKEDKFAPSNQKPRQILDSLGILCKHKYQRKNSIGYNNKSKRIYRIYKTDLERAVFESDFGDLKYKFDLTP